MQCLFGRGSRRAGQLADSHRPSTTRAEDLRRASVMSCHENHISGPRLQVIILIVNIANMLAFMDIAGNALLLATVNRRFNAGDSIVWAVAAQLIAASTGQMLLGYNSDLFGRRNMLVLAMGCLMLGSLFCGFSNYWGLAPLFYVSRAVSGFGDGAIMNLINVIQLDHMSPAVKRKYQGVQGISVAVGSILGLLVSAALDSEGNNNAYSHTGWPMFFYLEAMLAFVVGGLVLWKVPGIHFQIDKAVRSTLIKAFDYAGALVLTLVTVFTCVTTLESHGNEWSPLVIASLTLTLTFAALFYAWGIYHRREDHGVRPIVPFRLFHNRTLCVIFLQSFFFGAAYYVFQIFLPICWQSVKGYTPIISASWVVPYFIAHGLSSSCSPVLLEWLYKDRASTPRSYRCIAIVGFTSWTISMFLLGLLPGSSSNGAVVVFEIMAGIGSGVVFQNSIYALSMQVDAVDVAVTIGARNVIIFMGGAVGTALGSTITTAVNTQYLSPHLKKYASQAVNRIDNNGFNEADRHELDEARRHAVKAVFVLLGGLLASSLLLCFVFNPDRIAQSRVEVWKSSGAISEVEVELVIIGTKRSEEATASGPGEGINVDMVKS